MKEIDFIEVNKENYKTDLKDFLVPSEIEKFIKFKQNINISSFMDYLKVCEYLGLDMNEDINIEPVEYDTGHIFLRATQDGKVELKNNTIQVADKKYMLNKAM